MPSAPGEAGGDPGTCGGEGRGDRPHRDLPVQGGTEGSLGALAEELSGHLRIRLAQRDGQGRGEIGEQIDEQQLPRGQRRSPGGHGAEEGERDFAEVPAHEDAQGLADRGPHRTALDEHVDDRVQLVVRHDHVGGGPGRRRAAPAQREADVGEPDGGRIVGAVAGHRHRLAQPLVGLHDPHLVQRSAPGDHGHPGQDRVQGLVVHGLEFGTRQHDLVVGEHSQLGGDRPGSGRMVSGHHQHLHARGA